jgi:WD40 repeat protein
MKLKTLIIIALSFVFVQTNEAQKVLTTNLGHIGRINCLTYSSDGKYIASGGADMTVRLWDSQTGQVIKILKGHGSPVKSVVFSPNGKYILSWEGRGMTKKEFLKLWDVQRGKEIKVENLDCSFGITFSSEEKYITYYEETGYGSSNGLTILDLQTLERVKIPENALSCQFSQDNKYCIFRFEDHIEFWDYHTWQKEGEFESKEKHQYLRFSPDAKYIAKMNLNTNTIILLDSKTGKKIKSFKKGHLKYLSSVSFSPDSKYILSFSRDNGYRTLIRWDIQTGKGIIIYEIEEYLDKAAFSSNSNYIYDGTKYNSVKGSPSWETEVLETKIWDSKNGNLIKTFNCNQKQLTISPNGKIAFIESIYTGYVESANIAIWDMQSNEKITEFKGLIDNTVSEVAYSPDGRYVFSCLSSVATFWSTQTDQKNIIIEGKYTEDETGPSFLSDKYFSIK